MNLFLIEFYTNSPTGQSGWEINFAWVYAPDKQATSKRRSCRWPVTSG